MLNLNNKYLYAKGTCNVVVRNISSGDVEYQSNKVQTAQFTTTCDMGQIQAGIGNTTAINIPHNSAVNLTLTNADFSMEARAMQVGTGVSYGAVSPVCEVITADSTTLTVTETPAAPLGYSDAICNVVHVGDTNAAGTAYTLSAAGAVQDFAAVSGQTYVVSYFSNVGTSKYFDIGGSFTPGIKHVTVQIAVYSTAGVSSATQGTKVGDLYIIIPRMQFSGKADTDGSQTTAATTDLSGTALTYDDASATCDCMDISMLARVLYVPSADTTADVIGLVVVGGAIAMNAGATLQVPVKYVMRNNTLASPDYTALTYATGSSATATVSTTGLISAVAAGDTTITITMADPALTCVADLSVTE